MPIVAITIVLVVAPPGPGAANINTIAGYSAGASG